MAIYGRDYYGRAKYGGSQRFELAVDPFEAEISGYDAVSLTWNEPGGTWSGFRLVRNRNGFPISEDDGEVVLEFPTGYSGATGGQFLDTNLRGGWNYYAIFLWDTGAQVWERAAALDVLVPYDFDSASKLWDTMPDYYRQIRDDGAGFNQQKYRINPAIYLNNEQVVPNLQLASFLKLLGWGFDILRSQADQVMDGYNIDVVHVNRMALLAAQFGGEVEESAPAHTNRTMIRNMGWLYRKRGTLEGIRELLSLVTGWEIDVTLGPNLMLSEDQTNLVHPQPQIWDASVRYVAGDRVRYGNFLYQATQTAYGAAQGPPSTRTNNTWWDADVFIEPLLDRTVARTDTGDISTWQIEGPGGFISGGTHIGRGVQDPEDGTIYHRNALAFRNETGTDDATFTVRSIPRRADNLTSWNKRLVITDGIPVPWARKQWQADERYRAGDTVLYQGAIYEALGTTEAVPTVTTAWKRLGYDDRPRLCLSWWGHGPYNGTVNTGGKRQHGVISQFDENGDLLTEFVCNPASYTNSYFDSFNISGNLTVGRVPAKGAAWSSTLGAAWGVSRDDDGGYAYPVTTGSRTMVVTPALAADGNVAVTYRALTTSRSMGLVFRWSDNNNFWIATQTGLFKVVAGAAPANPSGGAVSWAAFQAGDRMRVNLSGNTIQVMKNGTVVGTATDSFNAAATRHGVEAEA